MSDPTPAGDGVILVDRKVGACVRVVGLIVGEVVVGLIVGEVVGLDEGETVGELDGLFVGRKVGEFEGGLVGAYVQR